MTAAVIESGPYKNLTASGAISTNPGALIGFYVNSTTSGVIKLLDGGSGGTAMGGNITPAAGTFHQYPAAYGSGGAYMTLVSGSIDVTFFYVPTANP